MEGVVADVADHGASRPAAAMSCLTTVTHSARREIGTHTSVTMPRAPGRNAMVAQNASCRACQSWLRSSARAVHWNSAPPKSRARSPRPSAPARPRGLPSRGTRRTASAHPVARELRMRMQASIGQLIEQLDACDRHARLDHDDDRVDRSSIVGNGHTAAEIASGMPCRRSAISVITPSVPSEPMSSRVRS